MTALPADVRAIVDARDQGICQRCGAGSAWRSRHHRKAKGMGGSKLYDTVPNIITLCGTGTAGCHGWVESNREEAYKLGLLVKRNSVDDPESISVETIHGRVFLLAGGSRVVVASESGGST